MNNQIRLTNNFEKQKQPQVPKLFTESNYKDENLPTELNKIAAAKFNLVKNSLQLIRNPELQGTVGYFNTIPSQVRLDIAASGLVTVGKEVILYPEGFTKALNDLIDIDHKKNGGFDETLPTEEYIKSFTNALFAKLKPEIDEINAITNSVQLQGGLTPMIMSDYMVINPENLPQVCVDQDKLPFKISCNNNTYNVYLDPRGEVQSDITSETGANVVRPDLEIVADKKNGFLITISNFTGQSAIFNRVEPEQSDIDDLYKDYYETNIEIAQQIVSIRGSATDHLKIGIKQEVDTLKSLQTKLQGEGLAKLRNAVADKITVELDNAGNQTDKRISEIIREQPVGKSDFDRQKNNMLDRYGKEAAINYILMDVFINYSDPQVLMPQGLDVEKCKLMSGGTTILYLPDSIADKIKNSDIIDIIKARFAEINQEIAISNINDSLQIDTFEGVSGDPEKMVKLNQVSGLVRILNPEIGKNYSNDLKSFWQLRMDTPNTVNNVQQFALLKSVLNFLAKQSGFKALPEVLNNHIADFLADFFSIKGDPEVFAKWEESIKQSLSQQYPPISNPIESQFIEPFISQLDYLMSDLNDALKAIMPPSEDGDGEGQKEGDNAKQPESVAETKNDQKPESENQSTSLQPNPTTIQSEQVTNFQRDQQTKFQSEEKLETSQDNYVNLGATDAVKMEKNTESYIDTTQYSKFQIYLQVKKGNNRVVQLNTASDGSVRLLYKNESGEGGSVDLKSDIEYTIGRIDPDPNKEPKNKINIPVGGNSLVSRRHLTLKVVPGKGIVLNDISANDTYLRKL